jgi:hypothetical protein
MIIVKIYGGMANQLFQYAAGYALALKHNVPLKLDLSYFNEANTDTKRVFELSKFSINYQLASQDEIDQVFKFHKLYYLWNKLLPIGKKRFYGEKHPGFYKYFFNLGGNLYLRGYFQSEKYFIDYKQKVLEQFVFKIDMSNQVQLSLKKIHESVTISLHVRLGDYLQPSTNSIMESFDLAYYKRAIEYMQMQFNHPRFLVFSDQIEIAKKLLHINAELIYVDASFSKNADEDFYLMQSCQHHIIANSTFSWWAAYLNQQPHKKVVAPQKWYKKHFGDATDLYPENWVIL